MENNDKSFRFTYSAKEQAEVASIRKKYLSQEENKLERLRKLDNSATQMAQACALSIGIIGTLILGFGMSLFMSELGALLNMSETVALVIGVIAGVVGLVLVAFAYPVYNFVLGKMRERIAPEILRLTDELLK